MKIDGYTRLVAVVANPIKHSISPFIHNAAFEQTGLGQRNAALAQIEQGALVEFADTRYTIRYFQSDGKGLLRNDNGTIFKPNDRYLLTKDVFRLYYTSLSTDRQTIDVYVEDSFGRVQQLTFSFNNEREEGKDKPASSRSLLKLKVSC